MTLSNVSTNRQGEDTGMFRRLLAGGRKRSANTQEIIDDLKLKKSIKIDAKVTFTSWDDCGRILGSEYGPHITDMNAFGRCTGKWMLKDADGALSIMLEDEQLKQAIVRVVNANCSCVEFEHKEGRSASTYYAFNTEEDDVAIFLPDGSVNFFYVNDEGVFRYAYNEGRESAHPVKDEKLIEAVKKAVNAPAKQSLIVDEAEGGWPKAVLKQSDTLVTVLNYHGKGKDADFSLGGQYDVPAFVIRASPNYNEKLAKVPLKRIKAMVEHEGALHMTSLLDLAKNAGKYGCVAGLDPNASLVFDDDEICTVRIQSIVLPMMEGGETEFYQTAYSYQTQHDDAPNTIHVYSTAMGSCYSASRQHLAKLQPYKYDKETDTLSAFSLSVSSNGKATDDDGVTKAEMASQAAGNKAVAAACGPVGFPKMADMSMVLQLPLLPKPVPVSAFRGGIEGGSDGGGVYRSLCASMPMDDEVGEVTGADLAYGDYQGDAPMITDRTPERDHSIKPTLTVTLYYALSAPKGSDSVPGECAIGREDIYNICKKMENLYEICGTAKNLMDPEANLAHKLSPSKVDAVMQDIAAKDGAQEKKKRRGLLAPPLVAAQAPAQSA